MKLKKKILALVFAVMMFVGTIETVDAVFGTGFRCVRVITSCGHPAAACGSSTAQIIEMAILADNFYCGN